MNKLTLSVLVTIYASLSYAESDISKVSEGITIVGDQELPQVLYLIPWKSPVAIQVDDPEFKEQIYLELFHPCDIPQEERPKQVSFWPCNGIDTDKNQLLK